MAFTWKPSIYDPVVPELYVLPKPIIAVVVEDQWDFQRLQVPIVAGRLLPGYKKDGVIIRVEGQIGTDSGITTEESLFQELERLRDKSEVQNDTERYEFFLYHDTPSSTYRKFKKCSTSRFRFDVTRTHVFTYALVVETEDPVLYTTGPGL